MTNTEIAGLAAKEVAASKAATVPRRRSLPGFLGRSRILIYQVLLIGGFLALWEVAIRAGWIAVYLYGQPTGIWRELIKGISSGALLRDSWVTTQETVIGFLIGSILGSAAGLFLWLSPT